MGKKRLIKDAQALSNFLGNVPVRIYRNLGSEYRHGKYADTKVYSVQTRTPSGWRVACHTLAFRVTSVDFTVSQSARLMTLKTRQKTPHAFVVGTLTRWHFLVDCSVTYNPYTCRSFIHSVPGIGYHAPTLEGPEAPIYRASFAEGDGFGISARTDSFNEAIVWE